MAQKYRKQIFIVLAFLIVLPVYFFFFFKSGIIINGTFMPKSTENGKTLYKGTDVTIRAERSENVGSVILLMPNDFKTYSVIVSEVKEYYKPIAIYEGNEEIFSGLYDGGNSSGNFRVFEKDGSPYLGETNIVINGEPQPLNSLNIVQLVNIFSEDTDIRGNVQLMLFAIIILIFWAIDFCYPRALFWLSHFISVENPEPSEFYLITQKISWVAIPILAAVVMIISLF